MFADYEDAKPTTRYDNTSALVPYPRTKRPRDETTALGNIKSRRYDGQFRSLRYSHGIPGQFVRYKPSGGSEVPFFARASRRPLPMKTFPLKPFPYEGRFRLEDVTVVESLSFGIPKGEGLWERRSDMIKLERLLVRLSIYLPTDDVYPSGNIFTGRVLFFLSDASYLGVPKISEVLDTNDPRALQLLQNRELFTILYDRQFTLVRTSTTLASDGSSQAVDLDIPIDAVCSFAQAPDGSFAIPFSGNLMCAFLGSPAIAYRFSYRILFTDTTT